MVSSINDINSSLKLLQEQLEENELRMEQYSDKCTPSPVKTIDYLVKQCNLREEIAFLKGVKEGLKGENNFENIR